MSTLPPAAGQLRGRRVLVHVGGSVAAVKTASVVTALRRRGAEVRVAMTPAATRFVGAATMQSVSGHPVAASLWGGDAATSDGGHGMAHLGLGGWAEVQVVVPASADLIARLALGLADDAVTATALASRAPLLVVPAMETAMWEHPATRQHLATLGARGATLVGPVSGRLASGHEGGGRMVEPDAVVAAVAAVLLAGGAAAPAPWLAGRRVVVTAGGTREPIDPVRFIGNRSSGRMGGELARAALDRGAAVTLVTAAPPPPAADGLTVVEVVTAADMLAAVRAALPGAALLVMAAAVADYRPAQVADRKLKKSAQPLALELVPTVDVLHSLREDPAREGVVVVGFAAETDDVDGNARAKLAAKGLDAIVANDVGAPGIGMGTVDNAVTVITRGGATVEVERAPKALVAERVLEILRPLVEDGRGG